MGKIYPVAFSLLASLILAAGFSGCAGPRIAQTEKLLTTAGFTPRQPLTPAQQEIYGKLRPYKMESDVVKGQRLYGYKDEEKGVVYVGGERQYREYKRLQIQRNAAIENMEATQMNSMSSGYYNAFGPSDYWR